MTTKTEIGWLRFDIKPNNQAAFEELEVKVGMDVHGLVPILTWGSSWWETFRAEDDPGEINREELGFVTWMILAVLHWRGVMGEAILHYELVGVHMDRHIACTAFGALSTGERGEVWCRAH